MHYVCTRSYILDSSNHEMFGLFDVKLVGSQNKLNRIISVPTASSRVFGVRIQIIGSHAFRDTRPTRAVKRPSDVYPQRHFIFPFHMCT